MENNYKEIKYKNDKFKVVQYISESDTTFNERIEYIKNAIDNNLSSKEAIRLSKIWYSNKYKNCKYDKSIYQQINI